MKKRNFYFVFMIIFLTFDQITKMFIFHSLDLFGSIAVIPGFFNLVHVHNRGAIFGFLSHSDNSLIFILLTLASFFAMSLIVYYFFKTPLTEKPLLVSLSLILAGALGNLIDRVLRGYVIDFLDVYVKKWHWPSFNLADSCITVGALLLVYIFLFTKSSKCSPS